MENTSFLLGFLSIFHIAGAIALGIAARGIWQLATGEGGSIGSSIFLVIWGGLFGCLPLAFGLDETAPDWLLPAQLLIWGTVFVITVFFGQKVLEWARPLFTVGTGLIVFGGIFILGGLFGGYLALGQGEILTALIIGGVFGIIGGVIFVLGLVNLFKG
jgi:hypothetical protein